MGYGIESGFGRAPSPGSLREPSSPPKGGEVGGSFAPFWGLLDPFFLLQGNPYSVSRYVSKRTAVLTGFTGESCWYETSYCAGTLPGSGSSFA